jgi:hypothetical protein
MVIDVSLCQVGLGLDCSPWVKAKIISHDEMLDRNWAHWTIFCQVCLSRAERTELANILHYSGRLLVSICWQGILCTRS